MAKVTAFEVFYKRLGPTGSNYMYSNSYPGGTSTRVTAGFLSQSWFTASVNTGAVRVSSSFINFPKDPSSTISYASTRNQASMSGYLALPWSSQVCDFLWNCCNMSWSFYNSASTYVSGGTQTKVTTVWTMAQNGTNGFHKANTNSPYGVNNYNITSSWHVMDPQGVSGYFEVFPRNFPSGSTFRYVSSDTRVATTFPVAIGADPARDSNYWDELLPNDGIGYTVKQPWTYDPNIPLGPTLFGFDNTTAPNSLEYFDKGVCAGIQLGQVYNCQYDFDYALSCSADPTLLGLPAYDPTNISNVTDPMWVHHFSSQFLSMSISLKQRRLFYPTLVSGSGTDGGTDYWHRQFTGYRSTEIFADNGGIYNVQFTLKRYGLLETGGDQFTIRDYQPKPGSCLKVFIANVLPNLSGSLGLKVGDNDPSVYPHTISRIRPGFYPPDNNVVICGHGFGNGPLMSFYDVMSKARVERFSVNLIQYGFPAQLCFEPCVVFEGDTFPLGVDRVYEGAPFGCMIDDISICKIGMTSDARYVQPLTIAQQTQNATTGSTIRGGGTIEFGNLEFGLLRDY